MKEEKKSSRIDKFLIWFRVFLKVLTLAIGVLWLSSYFVGLQRYQSYWSTKGTKEHEEARWFISNFGSFGYAWRTQHGEMGIKLPADYVIHTAFKGTTSLQNNVRPEGGAAWHWFHYLPQDNEKIGRMQTGYGHLYVPYWAIFLTSGLFTVLVSNIFKKRPLSESEPVGKDEPEDDKVEEKPKKNEST